jgi:hydantoinase/carbamoylase family amidase
MMKVNKKRLRENVLKIGEIGKGENGGISRIAFSKEFDEASKILAFLMEEAGLIVLRDKIGNVFGKRSGTDNSLPTIMIGSHLDTVKNGGLFDGNLGIAAALECINILNENSKVTRHPIEIVAFNAEEGSELGGTLGSRSLCGLIDLEENRLSERLATYKLTIEDLKDTKRDIKDIKAFLELHIEQGGKLEKNRNSIGIVEGIVGITRYKFTVKGETNHAGTTPMSLRRDALTGAAKLILEIDYIARLAGDPFVATIGKMELFPGSVNVIPGRVEFVLEMRDLCQDKVDKVFEEIQTVAASIEGVDVEYEIIIKKPPVNLDCKIINIIENVCRANYIRYQRMSSGAGHDAAAMAEKVQSAMIFVPSKDGKSHCPEEWTYWDDIETGTQTLLDTIVSIDKYLY